MAIHIEESSNRSRTFLWFFLTPILIFISVSILLAWFFQPVNGDLTRIGAWAERDYGWNKAQPHFKALPNVLSPSTDVLVIGDSFSEPNIWQTYVAEKTGLSLVTYRNDAICINQIPEFISAIDPGRHIKLVIVESVQRSLVNNFGNPLCSKSDSKVQPIQKSDDARYFANRPKVISPENIAPIYLAKVAYHSFLVQIEDSSNIDKVVNLPLTRSDLFSSRISNRILFYEDDMNKKFWAPEDMEKVSANIRHLDYRLKALGRNLLVVVVPDKSAVYQDYIKYDDHFGKISKPSLGVQLRNEGIAFIELQEYFRKKASEGIVDLYLPNDTHFGLEGFHMLADQVVAKIRYQMPDVGSGKLP